MPLIQASVSIAASPAVNDNVITGSQFEFLPYNASLRFALNGSAAGLVADVYSGQDVLAEQMGVNALNRVPINPDDFLLSDVAAAGERIKIRVRNTTAGALTLFYALMIDPI
jgi:hypothetical protein